MVKKYKLFIIGGLFLISVALIIYYLNINKSLKFNTFDDVLLTKKVETIKTKTKPINYYQVDIKGSINKPGVYSLKEDSRVIDVINIASGLTKDADTNYINLSKKICDEMVIIINSKKEINNYQNKISYIPKVLNQLSVNTNNDALIKSNDVNPIKNTNSDEQLTTKVSINYGTSEQLQTLSGIGESKAIDIIKYRTTNGNFYTLEDLKKVSGIGDATFAKIKENITL
jgi:competence protein ComEA